MNLGITNLVFKSFSFTSPTGATGIFYAGGFYEFAAADSNLNEVSQTQTFGDANSAHASHAFCVVAGVGADNKTVGAVRLKVSGTSITDAGVRATSDTEVLIADIKAATVITDKYFETSKKWIGQVTFTLENDATGDATTFSLDFNYGLAKYDDFGNRNFVLQDFECVGRAGANDSGFNIELIKHQTSDWTYHASAFVPGGNVITALATVHSTESNLVNNDVFAFKRANLSEAISGNDGEGFLMRMTTTANNAVEFMDIHVGGIVK